MIKATHRGNCQVCGAQHHVMGTVLALHGYTVAYGYFNGTCHGSSRRPVQTSRALTDETIEGLLKYAATEDTHLKMLTRGEAHPSRIETRTKYNPKTYKHEPEYIDFAAGTDAQKAQAVRLAIAKAESGANHARAHARSLKTMADTLHGTALVLIVDEPKVEAPKAVVDLKAANVTGAFPSKAARKVELEKVNRLYTKQIDMLQELYLALPGAQRTEAKTEVYYAPMYPHQWKPRHSAAALKEFPQAAAIVMEIELLVKVREVIKAAP